MRLWSVVSSHEPRVRPPSSKYVSNRFGGGGSSGVSVWGNVIAFMCSRPGRRTLRTDALDVGDEFEQLFFADMPLEGGHVVGITADDLLGGKQNRIAQVGFI